VQFVLRPTYTPMEAQMRDTYGNTAEADADRAQQRSLLAALNGWNRALRRDDCGAWCINGKQGSIHTWGDGATWVLYIACHSARHWSATKARMSFCHVTQDGDAEGCLRLHHPPTPGQAVVIRDALGIRKRMQLAPDDLERRRASAKWLAQVKGSCPARFPVLEPTDVPQPILEPEPAK
jgi:hypothetical protein